MSIYEPLNEMDPAARAVAEVRAREAGMSLGQWIETLVYEQVSPAAMRRTYAYGRLPLDRLETPGASRPMAPTTNYAHHLSLALSGFPVVATENSDHFHLNPGVQAANWSALRIITTFPPRISLASILLGAAFAEADVAFRLPPSRPSVRHKATGRWYDTLVNTCLHQSLEVRNALAHPWTPTGRAEQMWGDAFVTLCDLTPARHELLILFSHNRNQASIELAKYLDLATQQFELSANLLVEVDRTSPVEPTDEQRFAHLRATLLERAGGGVSLTEGSKLLGVSRQALHKRIKAGRALGMMDGDEIVLPRLQWVMSDDKVDFVVGLPGVVTLFERAGGWSALQFLLDPDPNLGEPPIEALRAGKVDAAVAAARAYLGLDEE
jgi:hypothetical protein